MSESQRFDYFQHHAVTVTEDRFSRMSVKAHPRGGWTIAEQSENSTINTYHGNYPSAEVAGRVLSEQRAAAVQTYMAEKIRAGIAKAHPAPQIEMSFG